MDHRPRNLIAIVVVATALLADRAAVAAPAVRAQVVGQTAARVIDRLTVRFRNVVPIALPRAARHDAISHVPVTAIRPADAEPSHRPSPPARFRTPPPNR